VRAAASQFSPERQTLTERLLEKLDARRARSAKGARRSGVTSSRRESGKVGKRRR
jgi:hypothetical protein